MVGLIAVGMVTLMIVWMRRHARGLKGELQSTAAAALAAGSTAALVGMAFFAVLREGFETAVFLLAAFNARRTPATAGIGAVLGLVAAIAIGYGIYRGGVRINLARFFRVTGLVLVLVAAGLLATSVHTAHEAGWFNASRTRPSTSAGSSSPARVRGSLLTGMLGLQPQPTVGEVVGYLLYAVPMALYVLWPDRWRRRRRARTRHRAGTRRRTRRRYRVTVARTLTVAAFAALAVVAAGCGKDAASSGAKKGACTITITLTSGLRAADLEVPAGAATSR